MTPERPHPHFDKADIERRYAEVATRHVRDDLTEYVIKHYERLLLPAEQAAVRYRTAHIKTAVSTLPLGTDSMPSRRLSEIHAQFPDLFARLEREGSTLVLREARDRVLREHACEVFLNLCSRCGGLCRTPLAKQCLRCGLDWHEPEGRPR